MFRDPQIDYHTSRAQQEMVSAIAAGNTAASAIHQELCLLHCGRVIAAMLFGGTRGAGRG